MSGPRVTVARSWKLRLIVILCAVLVVLGLIAVLGSPSRASASAYPKREVAYHWAVAQHGKPYQWGGTGPYGFDCSGLVFAAYRHAGITLPRTTYEMLAAVASGLLQPTGHPVQGDLAFYGSGHVELVTARPWHSTYGALDSGTLIGWHATSSWWHPTLFFHIRGAG